MRYFFLMISTMVAIRLRTASRISKNSGLAGSSYQGGPPEVMTTTIGPVPELEVTATVLLTRCEVEEMDVSEVEET